MPAFEFVWLHSRLALHDINYAMRSLLHAVYYTSVATGSDSSGDGSFAKPFATATKALAASRANGGGGSIVLRGGTYYSPEALNL